MSARREDCVRAASRRPARVGPVESAASLRAATRIERFAQGILSALQPV
jgi:hypothetical protein